ncbi:DUF2513 domain-containing protein [Veillonella criceti]|uniref:DUF2513 domain-containing protein n=1 Tax=Veillonella criceti TaxID=103891 RepID=A0A380NJW4_9FIRM|nr:DUF2513 domain-containing protein [Veillonella criceti]SUP42445.1 Uncharacterised protein [Veillonella criceti]
MKRDLDLLRNILITIEGSDTDLDTNSFLHLCDDIETIDYHIYLLADAGYIDYYDISCCNGSRYPQYLVKYLTSDGCDYLSSIKDDNVWSHVKKKINKVGDSVTLETIKIIGSKFILQYLGL